MVTSAILGLIAAVIAAVGSIVGSSIEKTGKDVQYGNETVQQYESERTKRNQLFQKRVKDTDLYTVAIVLLFIAFAGLLLKK